MLRNTFIILIIVAAAVVLGKRVLDAPTPPMSAGHHEAEHEDYPRGPHNGRLLEQDGFALEVTIFEAGVPPQFHLYPSLDGRPLPPGDVEVSINLGRTGNVIDHFEFTPRGEYLYSESVVREPHSFDVNIHARHAGKQYQWSYASYEGRTQIARELADAAGLRSETAGPAAIEESVFLSGRVEIDPGRLAQVRPRFKGVVQVIHVELGAMVRAGQRLLTMQSNESLQDYPVLSPITGMLIKRNVQPGQPGTDDPLLTIVDLSEVWVELDVFAKDVARVRTGQAVDIETLDGFTAQGTIDWLSPLSSHASQSIHARVPLANPSGALRPGQFVKARVHIATHAVALAVRQSALQAFRDFRVVFAKFGETYEVRMLETGRYNQEWIEVVGGLEPGTEYVTENSYLVKADIEKSGASHHH